MCGLAIPHQTIRKYDVLNVLKEVGEVVEVVESVGKRIWGLLGG